MPDQNTNASSTDKKLQVTKQVAIEDRVKNEKKSLGVAYALWLLLLPVATLGLQNFYVGRKKLGWLELCCTGLAILFGIIAFSFFFGDSTAGTAVFGPIFAIFVLIVIVCWIWDLFTLPTALTHHTSKLRDKIAKELDEATEIATEKLDKLGPKDLDS